MESTAHIQLNSDATQVRFDWVGFDGDDCFIDFRITVKDSGQIRCFEFGPCAIWGLRKLVRFFTDTTKETVGGGFRHPDIRYFDIYRSGDVYRLVVRFEDNALHEEFQIHAPSVQIAD